MIDTAGRVDRSGRHAKPILGAHLAVNVAFPFRVFHVARVPIGEVVTAPRSRKDGERVGKGVVRERLAVVNVDESQVLGVVVRLPRVDSEPTRPLLADLPNRLLTVNEERPPLGAVELALPPDDRHFPLGVERHETRDDAELIDVRLQVLPKHLRPLVVAYVALVDGILMVAPTALAVVGGMCVATTIRVGGLTRGVSLRLVVEAVAEHGPTGTTGVADALDCSYDLAYRRLRELEDEGRVTSDRVGNARLWRVDE